MTRLTDSLEPSVTRDARTTVRFPGQPGGSFFQGWGPKA
jgi:hypothetical protein